jgi:site-specific recombinase XerD
MAREGLPIHLIQAIMGHANSATTSDIYTHVLANDLKVVRERMNVAFGRAQKQATDLSV